MARKRELGRTGSDPFPFFAHDHDHDWGYAYASAYHEARRDGLDHLEARKAARQVANEVATLVAESIAAETDDEIYRRWLAISRRVPSNDGISAEFE